MKHINQVDTPTTDGYYGDIKFRLYTTADPNDDAAYDKFEEIMGLVEAAMEAIPTDQWAYKLQE